MSVIEKFKNIVSKLEKQGIIVNHFYITPPNENEILQTQIDLGYELHPSIIDFYSECNGLELIWTKPTNPEFNKLSKKIGWNENSFEPNESYDGVICIKSIHESFIQNWNFDFTYENQEVEFTDKIYQEPDFSNRIKPFDFIHKYGSSKYDLDVAFFLDGNSNPLLILGDDYQSNYRDSRTIHFDIYLDFLLRTAGNVEARYQLLKSVRGYKKSSISAAELEKFLSNKIIKEILPI